MKSLPGRKNRQPRVGATDQTRFEPISKAHSLLAQAEEMARLGSWEHDCDTAEEVWSPNLCRIMGRGEREETFPALTFWETLHPEDRQMVGEVIDRAMKEKKSYEYRARFILPDGHVHVLHTRAKVVVDSKNRVARRMGVTQDITERLEIEERFSKSEERYRDLVENSCDLICTHDLNGELLSMNETPARLLGYRAEQLIGKRIPELLLPEYRDRFSDYIEVIRHQGHVEGLASVPTRTGERRVWEYRNTLKIEGVSAPIVRGFARDVTDAHSTEKEVRTQRELLQTIFDHIPLMLSKTDTDGRFLWVNREWEHTFGWSLRELKDNDANLLDQFDSTPGKLKRTLKLLEGLDGEWHDCKPHARYRKPVEVSWTKVKLSDGSLLGIGKDITEAKRAHESLRRSEFLANHRLSELNAIYETAPVGLCFVDRDLRYVRINDVLAAANGIPASEHIGRTIREIIPQLADQLEPMYTQVFASGESLQNVELQRATSGELAKRSFWNVSISPLKDETGLILGCNVVVQDITLLKQAEESLRHLSSQLIQIQDLERRRISRALHETLAQDLAGLKMLLGQVKRSPKLSRQATQVVKECIEMNRQIIDQIRTLSYLVHPSSLEIGDLASSIRGWIAGFSKRSEMRVALDLPDEIGPLPIEYKLALYRVMQESLTNVHRHSRSTSALVRISRNGENMRMEILDYGKGMDVHRSKRTDIPIGIGITEMRERIQQLNGSFQIDSSPGKGVIVRVDLQIPDPTIRAENLA